MYFVFLVSLATAYLASDAHKSRSIMFRLLMVIVYYSCLLDANLWLWHQPLLRLMVVGDINLYIRREGLVLRGVYANLSLDDNSAYPS